MTSNNSNHNSNSSDYDYIVNVWNYNLEEEFQKVCEIVEEYNYVAMDTEFPGVVARPMGSFIHDYHYQTLKCNVDLLNLIQVGFTFYNSEGKRFPGKCTWQFNFKFNLTEDMYALDSIEMLQRAGIDFKSSEEKGIDPYAFSERLMMSGLVLSDDVRWLSFHSGYDFGYLLKLLTWSPLPEDENKFFDLLYVYFPGIYDLKYMMKHCEELTGGLSKLAEDLSVERIGSEHQAGSDSLLTGEAFVKLRSKFFENMIDDDKYLGVIFGLGQTQRRKPTTAQ